MHGEFIQLEKTPMHAHFAPLGRALKTAVLIVSLAVLAGCSGSYSRGIFTGYVIGTPAEAIESKVGKPVAIDAANPDQPRWVYEKKTFDPDNMNKVDEKTIIILERRDGKFVGADILFG
jgi:hypothetical protein